MHNLFRRRSALNRIQHEFAMMLLEPLSTGCISRSPPTICQYRDNDSGRCNCTDCYSGLLDHSTASYAGLLIGLLGLEPFARRTFPSKIP